MDNGADGKTAGLEAEIGDKLKTIGMYTGRMLFKKILLPFLPLLLIGGAIFFMIASLIGAVYSAFSSTGTLAGVYENKEEDAAMRDKYEELCGKYNVLDTWVVNSETVTEADGNTCESSPDNPYYPGSGVLRANELIDSYGQDEELRLLWGQAHAAVLYFAYTNELSEITEQLQEKVTDDLHPFFYYKKSQVVSVSCDADGVCETTVYDQYLLVEAYTIQGHFQYHYQWETKTFPAGGSITREVFRERRQIMPSKWLRLEDWILTEYHVNEEKKDLAMSRMAVWEAGHAFDESIEWLNWLANHNANGSFVTVSTIPPELMPLFLEAEEAYGVPWWFLAAIAFKESSFNPLALNPQSGCYGLMQFSPSNWLTYTRMLGFHPIMDRDNPRAQILCSAYMLNELGLKFVDWESAGWQEQTLDVLAFYGGFRGSDAQQRCLTQYAQPIWQLAEEFKSPVTIWPVPGHNTISSYFGWRNHPVYGSGRKHNGIDIPAPQGTTVTSASSGVVTFAGWENPSNHNVGFGLFIVVQDQMNAYIYGHLSSIGVDVGQQVGIGAELGQVGSTGVSTGPHLHFEIRSGGMSGEAKDPLLILGNSAG